MASRLATPGLQGIPTNRTITASTSCANAAFADVVAAIHILATLPTRKEAVAEVTARIVRNVEDTFIQRVRAVVVRFAWIQVRAVG